MCPVAEQVPAIKCPSCGSTDVAAVPLSLIETKYYKCGNCIVTFRAPSQGERPDIDRFNEAWFLPPDDKKKS
jgi:hypothetical protein